jgi:uroporphyrinogen-III synthase
LEAPQKEALDNGLRIDILAPSPNAPNDNGLRKYILEANKGK